MVGENIVVGAGLRDGLAVQGTITSGTAPSGGALVAAALAEPIQGAELRAVQVAWGYGRGRDSDRDGIPDRHDRDRDGDGIPNRFDPNPNRPNYPAPRPHFPRPPATRPCYWLERPDFYVNGIPRCYR